MVPIEKTAPPKITKVLEELSCDLNQVEWENRAREMADASLAVESALERKKAINKQSSNDVATAQAKAAKLTSIVHSRSETREVTVEIKYDYETGKVTRTRTDTDVMLSERDMTTDERQGTLVDANDFIEDAERGADDESGTATDEEILDDDSEDDTVDEEPEAAGEAEEYQGRLDDPEDDDEDLDDDAEPAEKTATKPKTPTTGNVDQGASGVQDGVQDDSEDDDDLLLDDDDEDLEDL